MHPSSVRPLSSVVVFKKPEHADRWLAVAAYLGFVVGLWLIAPIAVYLLRRRRSRFVAHHAVQAGLLHLLFGPLLTVCVVLAVILGVVATLVVDMAGGFGVEILILLGWCCWLVPAGIHVGLTVGAAWRAYRGRVDTASRLGRMSEWLLAHDRGLPPPADGV